MATVSYSFTSAGRLYRADLEVSSRLGERTGGNVMLCYFTVLLKTQVHNASEVTYEKT